jgi:AcrR family transcriptional regulator
MNTGVPEASSRPAIRESSRDTDGQLNYVEFLDESIQLRPLGATEMRGRILDAARRVARRYGMSKLRMSEVAIAARVSRASLYKYFPDRKSLVQALIDWGISCYGDDLHQAVASTDNLENQILASVLVARAYWDADEEYAQEWNRPYRDRVIIRQAEKFFPLMMHALRPALRDAQRDGSIRMNLNIEQASEWLARIIHSMAVTPGITFSEHDESAIAAFVRSFVIAGLD